MLVMTKPEFISRMKKSNKWFLLTKKVMAYFVSMAEERV